MNKKMISGLVCVLGFSTFGFNKLALSNSGASELGDLLANSTGKPFEVLKNLFDKSSSPLTIDEVGDVNQKAKIACALAGDGASSAQSLELFTSAVHSSKDGGPLFPIEVKVFLDWDTGGRSALDDSFFYRANIEATPIAIVQTVSKGYEASLFWSRAELRKNDKYLTFRVDNHDGTVAFYAYCWGI